MRLFATKLSG